jgi:DNA polymerase III alpha subunit
MEMPRIRTGYSFHFAYGHLSEVAARLQVIGWPRQPISDRTSTYGFNRWAHLVPNPMFGVELAVSADLQEKRPTVDWWTFFAIKELGSIHALIAEATSIKKGEPALSYAKAIKAKDVIKILGNAALLDKVKPKTKNLYVALSPSTPKILYTSAKKLGFQFIASSDNAFPAAQDKEIYRIAIRRANVSTYPQYILSDEEWRAAIYFADEEDKRTAIENRDKVFTSCIAKIEKAELFVPEKPTTLENMCRVGAKRKGVDLSAPVYAERLARELKLIAEKKFEDYFYIIADIIAYAKTKMIVGPARGSSSGSLVCYLLDITTIDPLKYNLIFERFIDINRADLPDIDIDFSDERRDIVFKYVEEKFGREYVARLGTTGMFRPRSVLNAAAVPLRIPQWRIDKVTESLIERSGGDSRANQQLEDTLKDTEAGKELLKDYPILEAISVLEDHPSNASQHAAGVCVTKRPIERYVAVDHRTFSAMCDKKDAEAYNMLKIDMLGLTQLSIFERTLDLMGERYTDGYLERIPLDDPAALKVLNDRRYSGIFQFNGSALQSLSKQIEFKSLEDIISVTALARPGPLATGGANRWTRRHEGLEPVTYIHPMFEPYLKDTLGEIIYQEQVMQIGRELGDLSWEAVTHLRKTISQSLGKEHFDKFGEPWKKRVIEKGMPPDVAIKAWDHLCQFGSWAFNRAHSVAYGLVSYYCCYFKAHYPLPFAAATLDAESLPARQLAILRELKEEGIDYRPVDPNVSEERWTIQRYNGKRVLLGPLSLIMGIGPAFIKEIKAHRLSGVPLRDVLANKLANPYTEIDTLFPISDKLKTLPDAEKHVNRALPIIQAQTNTFGYITIIGVLTRVAPRDMNDAANIAKRGGTLIRGPSMTLNLYLRDDSDEIFCKVTRLDYLKIGKELQEQAVAGKSLYAFTGSVWDQFRMLFVKKYWYLGEMDRSII